MNHLTIDAVAQGAYNELYGRLGDSTITSSSDVHGGRRSSARTAPVPSSRRPSPWLSTDDPPKPAPRISSPTLNESAMSNAEPQVGCFTRLFSLNRKRKGTAPSTEERTEDLTRRAPLPVGDVKAAPLNSACGNHHHDEELVSPCPRGCFARPALVYARSEFHSTTMQIHC